MAKKTRRPRKRPIQETDSYVLEIMEWEPICHISIGKKFLTDDEYWEHGSFELEARGLLPKFFFAVGKTSQTLNTVNTSLQNTKIDKAQQGQKSFSRQTSSDWSECEKGDSH